MSWFSNLFSSAAAKPIEAVGNVLDELFTSDDEKLTHKELMAKLVLKPSLAQVELNKVEATHRSIFVAGWRPFIGWVCGAGIAFTFIVNPVIQWITNKPGPEIQIDIMVELVTAMLGLAGLRTIEKMNGKTK